MPFTPTSTRTADGGAAVRPMRLPGRILVVAPEPFYEDRGTPIAIRHVLTALSELGAQVDLLTFPVGAPIELPGLRIIRVPNPLGIRSVPIGFSLRKLWFDAWLFAALKARLRAERYAAIHAVEEGVFLAAMAARGTGVPILYDMQSSLAEQMAERPLLRNRLVRRLLLLCERWALRRATTVMCSAGLKASVLAEAPQARVNEWIYPGQATTVPPEMVETLRAELGIPSGRPVILYMGNFAIYQGVGRLIDAVPSVLAGVPSAVFVLIGAEPESLAAVSRLLADRVPPAAYRVLLRQPRERMPVFLALADIVVSPRVSGRNLPLKVLDYIAAGQTIVATKIPAHQSVLTEQLAVLAEPTSEGLAHGMLRLLRDAALARQLEDATRAYAADTLTWAGFLRQIRVAYEHTLGVPGTEEPRGVSVIIPARNAEGTLGRTVRAVRAQGTAAGVAFLEVLVVDDHSTDGTAREAQAAGASVLPLGHARGNPGAARNHGASAARGELLLFLDADCTPADGWLAAHVHAHRTGAVCVGGPLGLPEGLPLSAQWDYYSSSYHTHPRRPAGPVPNHPPCNLSVQAELFRQCGGFTERQPVAHGHEELAWQAALRQAGHAIRFEPRALAYHWNRPGWSNLLRRNYRWAYSALESKAAAPAVRLAWLYRHPALLISMSVLLAVPQGLYILGCWVRAGRWEALAAAPAVLAARAAYAAGSIVGGSQWLLRRGTAKPPATPRWT